MFKRFIIHYKDKIFGENLINYDKLKLIIIFPKISYYLSLSIVIDYNPFFNQNIIYQKNET